jgi:uncharacterized protein YjbI with pentapeptide repeats
MNRNFTGGRDTGKNLPSQPLDYTKRNWPGGLFTKVNFKNLTFDQIEFVGANLEQAVFDNVRLRNVDFSGANLKSVVIRNSTLENVNFTGGDLRGLKFEGVRSRNMQLRGVLHDQSLNLGAYNSGNLRQMAYGIENFDNQIQNEPATFLQDVLAPLLFAPLQLRPLHLLYWMVPTPMTLPTRGLNERQ